jgi:hypothetical protein
MMRVAVLLMLALTVAGCSGSSRVENIVPAWANSPSDAGAPRATRQADRIEQRD